MAINCLPNLAKIIKCSKYEMKVMTFYVLTK